MTSPHTLLLLLLLLQAIESATGQRTCIVYGALPAETRRQQVTSCYAQQLFVNRSLKNQLCHHNRQDNVNRM
jgi:hypothetical protein